MSPLAVFFALLVGHAIADYPLQGSFIGNYKNRYRNGTRTPMLLDGQVVWPWVLSAHGAIHAGFVWAITGSAILGICEFAVHVSIDYAKGTGAYGRHAFAVDQSLHVACKILWVAALAAGLR